MKIPYGAMKATLTERVPPDDEAWAFEVKWDGMRIIAAVDASDDDAEPTVALWSAAGNDATARFPEILPIAEVLRPHTAVLDGEVVALDPDGRPDFGRLQPRMQARSDKATSATAADQAVTFIIFDLLELDGNDLTGQAYEDRHRLLDLLIEPSAYWTVTDSWTGGGAALLDAMDAAGMEGLIAKRLGSRYEAGRRSSDWLKIKVRRRQELVVGGWLPGKGNRAETFGALLVGYYPDDVPESHRGPGVLVYAGRIGTGFRRTEQDRLVAELSSLAADTSPFAAVPPDVARAGRWVRPELVVEAEFGEWTGDGVMRHPAYMGQRFDRIPQAVILESPSTET